MFKLDHPQKSPLFDYYAPQGDKFRGLVSIPHSGEYIPPEFVSYLSGQEAAYQSDVDFKVNELVDISALQQAGVAVLVAHVHRICVDLNRAEENCVLFWKKNTRGEALVTKDPSLQETQRFIETYHRPYFEVLKSAIQDLEKRQSSPVSMVDLHSMPSRPTAYHMQQNPHQAMQRPDFCLSDRKGKTCQAEFIDYFQRHFSLKGYQASLNDPYVGGFVTEFVDRFRTNNIQIEIKRGIYMDEVNHCLISEKVPKLRQDLTDILLSGFNEWSCL